MTPLDVFKVTLDWLSIHFSFAWWGWWFYLLLIVNVALILGKLLIENKGEKE